MNPELLQQSMSQEYVNAQFDQISAGIGELAADPMMDYVRAMQNIDMSDPNLMETAASAVSEASLSIATFDEAYTQSNELHAGSAFAAANDEAVRRSLENEDDDEELQNA